jgi:hypothetical protein
MRPNLDKLLALSLLSLAMGCNWLGSDRPKFRSAKAEITAIEKASDTSVFVQIEVFENGNSDRCRLKIFFDTTAIKRGPSITSTEVTAYVPMCGLERVYLTTVFPLVKGQEYFFQIFQQADWFASGTTHNRGDFIGSQQKFMIQ